MWPVNIIINTNQHKYCTLTNLQLDSGSPWLVWFASHWQLFPQKLPPCSVFCAHLHSPHTVSPSLCSIPSIRSITFISLVYIYLLSLEFSQDLILGYGSGTANTWVWQKEDSGSPSSRIFLTVFQQNRHPGIILFPYVES